MDDETSRDLLWAAERGDAARVLELVRAGGVNLEFDEERDEWSPPETALCRACSRGHEHVARILLDHGAGTPGDLEKAFCDAATAGRSAVLKLLLEKGVDPSARNSYAIRWATAAEVVELLLCDARVDPAADNNYAVRRASMLGNCDVLRLLLKDERVDGALAILGAHGSSVPILLEDERVGISVNRVLFEQHHGHRVVRYVELARERTARIVAVSWAMKQIGQGLREPMEERMQMEPLDWDRPPNQRYKEKQKLKKQRQKERRKKK